MKKFAGILIGIIMICMTGCSTYNNVEKSNGVDYLTERINNLADEADDMLNEMIEIRYEFDDYAKILYEEYENDYSYEEFYEILAGAVVYQAIIR